MALKVLDSPELQKGMSPDAIGWLLLAGAPERATPRMAAPEPAPAATNGMELESQADEAIRYR
jgi:hypothetical protein